MISRIEVTVTSHDSRDEMYAELFAGSVQCAEVSVPPGSPEPIVTIFPPLDGNAYEFTVAGLQAALAEAVSRLRILAKK